MCTGRPRIYDFTNAIDPRSTDFREEAPVSILAVACLCGVLVAGAFGIYDLQTRLERWDRDRHAED